MRCDFKELFCNSGQKFQSTHLHEVWLSFFCDTPVLDCFNPHTYMRCDTQKFWLSMAVSAFQSTHLHEVWLLHSLLFFFLHSFQSTHLHEVWLTLILFICFIIISFNPHTYMRCDEANCCIIGILQSFNPHTYMRCDFWLNINIGTIYCFNPHTYMRCDVSPVSVASIIPLFQSTHLHEVWPFLQCCSSRLRSFQSTHLHEVWHPSAPLTNPPLRVSIHTPTWGVTYIPVLPLLV